MRLAAALMTAASASGAVRPLLLEHVNLNIPDRELARAFYAHALGGRVNPVSTNERLLHVNVGVSQFHMPTLRSVRGREPVTIAQRWGGTIELLTTEPLEQVAARVRETGYAVRELKEEPRENALADGGGEGSGARALAVDGPWASSFVLRRAPAELAPAVSRRRGHAGGTGPLIAMPRATVLCRPGAAPLIASFYRGILGLAVHESAGRARLDFEPCAPGLVSQSLEFIEHADAPPADAYDRSEEAAIHVAIYLPDLDSFGRAFKTAEAAGRIYINPRFEGGPPEYASARTMDEAIECGQFRVKDCIDPDSGELGIVLEHEVRHPGHRAFPLGDAPRE
jgi:catechol 2,3-dioxygenase-like lactoylglutathione lyase family enzyme